MTHTDFLKAITVIPQLKVLVTGSSDKDIRIWDLAHFDTTPFASLYEFPAPHPADDSAPTPPVPAQSGAAPPAPTTVAPLPFLLSLKGHIRPIERLAAFPVFASSESGDDEERTLTDRTGLISVDSLGAMKVWELWRGEDGMLKGELKSETRPHEIGIYDLVVSAETNEIWTGELRSG